MKLNLILLLLLSFPLFIHAQSESRQCISITGGSNFSYLAGKNIGSFHQQSPDPGYHFRVSYERKMTNRLWLRTGVGYSKLYYQVALDIPGLQWPSQNNNGQFDPTKTGDLIVVNKTDGIFSIPFGIRYDCAKHFYADADVNLNAINRSTIVFRPGFGVAIGYQTALKPNMHLFIQPAAHLLMNNPVDTGFQLNNPQLLSFGLEAGLRGFLR